MVARLCYDCGISRDRNTSAILEPNTPPRKKLFKPRSPTGFGPKPPTNDNQLVVFSLHAKGEVSALAVVTRSRRKPQQRLCRPTSPLGRSDRPLALLLSSFFARSHASLSLRRARRTCYSAPNICSALPNY